jgi:hypothetical protein
VSTVDISDIAFFINYLIVGVYLLLSRAKTRWRGGADGVFQLASPRPRLVRRNGP